MDGIFSTIFDAVKDNIVVQWFLVVIVILVIGTSTAEKLKGPIGSFARWARGFGAARDERESQERQKARDRARSLWEQDRDEYERRLHDVEMSLEAERTDRENLRELITTHLGWDYDRVEQLISLGVEPATIPQAPPLRIRLIPGPTAVRTEPQTNPQQRRIDRDDLPPLT